MPESQMLINYVPGEECRVAIVEDGRLEELYVEKFANASRVGNIYVGKVSNVEPAIQAAFVDFGVGENGFLHITDLHPRYFPGEGDDTTERVGLKTPRRERPLIQQALRRGDEVIVQVLKEGVGTKGPTLTSYLSVPGRFLVMMPYMDKVGVSRKVEDEEQRREMREILDQLSLPEGFGFILRTAGMDRTKTDLKRDLAYLQRLWKDMERRRSVGGKPRLLYSESDLLVRSLRDLLSNEIQEVVIDSEVAVARAARFMKIVAPRGTTKLYHYPGKSPIFHAFNVEREIGLIHAREVPLPSGGRLVIDQTEALVAIDVNSGKSRESRDAETNAYQTNIEAVDEICRQLRLRDMGGIVINDLIDMRRIEHRKDIEKRFQERMKRDRAKSTVLSISEFGILQMTRQRMRASHESAHFSDCPTCRGRGLVQKPDSIAGDALRDLSAVLDVESVKKVELAVSPRVAGELLSHKRQLLGRVERAYGKHVDVRVSETVPIDRVMFYAYDDQGADIDLTNLSQPRKPRDKDLHEFELPTGSRGEEEDWSGDHDQERREAEADETAADEQATKEEVDLHPIEIDEEDDVIDDEWGLTSGGSNQSNRRRGGGGSGGGGGGRGGRPAPAPGNRDNRAGGRDAGGRDARGGRDGRDSRDGRGGRPNSGGGGRDGGGGGRSDRGPRREPAVREPAVAGAGHAPGRHSRDGGIEPRLEDSRAEGARGPSSNAANGNGGVPTDDQAQLGDRDGSGRRRRRRGRGRGRGRAGEGEFRDGAPANGASQGSDDVDAVHGDGDDRENGPRPNQSSGFVPLVAGGGRDDEDLLDSDVNHADARPSTQDSPRYDDRPGAIRGRRGSTPPENGDEVTSEGGEGAPLGPNGEAAPEGEEGRGRRRRRRRGRGRGRAGADPVAGEAGATDDAGARGDANPQLATNGDEGSDFDDAPSREVVADRDDRDDRDDRSDPIDRDDRDDRDGLEDQGFRSRSPIENMDGDEVDGGEPRQVAGRPQEGQEPRRESRDSRERRDAPRGEPRGDNRRGRDGRDSRGGPAPVNGGGGGGRRDQRVEPRGEPRSDVRPEPSRDGRSDQRGRDSFRGGGGGRGGNDGGNGGGDRGRPRDGAAPRGDSRGGGDSRSGGGGGGGGRGDRGGRDSRDSRDTRDSRGGRDSRDSRDTRDSRDDRSSRPAPSAPESNSSGNTGGGGGGSTPAAPLPPKPRTLYGAARRKLSASELNRRPKAE